MANIDWDKVRREKNAHKPDYRENFRHEWVPAGYQQKEGSAVVATSLPPPLVGS